VLSGKLLYELEVTYKSTVMAGVCCQRAWASVAWRGTGPCPPSVYKDAIVRARWCRFFSRTSVGCWWRLAVNYTCIYDDTL